jgi:hypothetical protein
MAVINTKGVTVYLSKATETPVDLVPTAISTANPAVVTVAATTGVVKGDIVTFETTGFKELDGKTFVVGAVTGTTFEAVGGNTTGSTGTLGATPKAKVHVAADQVKLCLSALELGADAVSNIDVGTFCDPSAQIPGKATPGAITLSGYADTTDAGLAEVIVAADDQQERFFQIVLPGANGYLVGKISLAGFSMGVPLEGAVTWTVSGTQASKIRWVH